MPAFLSHVSTLLRGVLRAARGRDDPGAWVAVPAAADPTAAVRRVHACAFPRTDRALARLAADGVSVLVNLAERSHDPERLVAHGLRAVHVPVPDFSAPTAAQLAAALAAIDAAHAAGEGVAVHCTGGLGRTGTVIACHLVRRGFGAEAAVAQVRAARPGAIETAAQRACVRAYAAARAAERRGEHP